MKMKMKVMTMTTMTTVNKNNDPKFFWEEFHAEWGKAYFGDKYDKQAWMRMHSYIKHLEDRLEIK